MSASVIAMEDTESSPIINKVNDVKTNIDCYRNLVHKLINLRRYKSASFWAEKIIVLSDNNPKDIYNLAQCMFLLKEYNRASHIIRRHQLEKKNLLCLLLLVECLYSAKDYQEALNLITSNEFEELGTSLANEVETDSSEFYDADKNDILSSLYLLKAKILESMDKRTLAIDCYILSLLKSVYQTEALDALLQHEMLNPEQEKQLLDYIMPAEKKSDESDLKLLKYLYESRLKSYYKAPTSHPEKTPSNSNLLNALCQKLKKNESSFGLSTSTTIKGGKTITSPSDLSSSPVFSIQNSLSRVSMQNTSRTLNSSKIQPGKPQNFMQLTKVLNQLENSVDVMVSRAEKCFYNCEYKRAMKIIETILERDPYHKKTLFVKIGCLMEMNDSNALFYMAHKLVDLYPEEAISWYAVGCYYDLINKTEQARRYLNKAASLDRLFGPAWLAYGHSLAKEKEHDQAMAAYFKATQLMQGCHLPLLYIGVECGLTKNFEMAEKFFIQALNLAPFDVFVLHEMGVIKFESESFKDAEEIFKTTLKMITDMCEVNKEPMNERWEPLLNNLGHCCRKNKKYQESLHYHTRALSLKPLSSQTYTSIGFVQALMGDLEQAVESFHKSLALKRDDVITSTILKTVLEDLVNEMVEDDLPDEMKAKMEIESMMEESKSSGEPNRQLYFEDNESDLSVMSMEG